jgi:hypothetical protein
MRVPRFLLMMRMSAGLSVTVRGTTKRATFRDQLDEQFVPSALIPVRRATLQRDQSHLSNAHTTNDSTGRGFVEQLIHLLRKIAQLVLVFPTNNANGQRHCRQGSGTSNAESVDSVDVLLHQDYRIRDNTLTDDALNNSDTQGFQRAAHMLHGF